MAVQKIQLKDLGKAIQKKVAQIGQAAEVAAYNAVLYGQKRAVDETKNKPRPRGGKGAVDRGGGGGFLAQWDAIKLRSGAEYGNRAPYAEYIEYGSRPHWVPFGVLFDWAKRKKGDIGLKDSELYKFAKAVQRKIAREGIPPMHIMTDLFPKVKKAFAREVNNQLSEVAKKKV